jgi:hypothetical protein
MFKHRRVVLWLTLLGALFVKSRSNRPSATCAQGFTIGTPFFHTAIDWQRTKDLYGSTLLLRTASAMVFLVSVAWRREVANKDHAGIRVPGPPYLLLLF